MRVSSYSKYILPRKLIPSSKMSSVTSSNSSKSSSKSSAHVTFDNIDKFINYLLSSKPRVRFAVITEFEQQVNHPVYTHLLKTLDSDNAQYIIGYLRSQKMYEMHRFIDNTISQIE